MRKHFLRTLMRHRWTFVLGAILLATSQTWADTIKIGSGDGVSGLGSFSGTLSYDQGAKKLTIVLTNTSPLDNGGFITGFAFNVNGAATAQYISGSSSYPFQGLSGSVKAQPFGYFEAGAALGANWDGGGTPSDGIDINDSGTFVFQITGADATKLTAESFISEGSVKDDPSKKAGKPGKGGLKDNSDDDFASSQLFVVRFRGFEDGGSYKGPGQIVLVPLPSAAWNGFALLGVLGLGGIRHRMRRA